ncbi:hypothetical protein AgCh_004353 [Apium graveolens]
MEKMTKDTDDEKDSGCRSKEMKMIGKKEEEMTDKCTVRTFQRFAVRTEKQFQELSEKAVEKRREMVEMMKDISKGSEPPTR